jgi:hypothetical protein
MNFRIYTSFKYTRVSPCCRNNQEFGALTESWKLYILSINPVIYFVIPPSVSPIVNVSSDVYIESVNFVIICGNLSLHIEYISTLGISRSLRLNWKLEVRARKVKV